MVEMFSSENDVFAQSVGEGETEELQPHSQFTAAEPKPSAAGSSKSRRHAW